MKVLKPKRLRPGDKLAVVSLSWGGPAAYPDLYEHGLANLADFLDVKIVEYPTARMTAKELSDNPRARAEDINHAFADPAVDGIISSIGGYDSVRILPYIEATILQANPKIIMGYSDTTTVLAYANLLGLVTFYGPSVMGGIAQLENMPESHRLHVKKMLCGDAAGDRLPIFERWSDGYPDFGNTAAIGQVLSAKKNDTGWVWVQGAGVSEGRLWGGCIEVLEFLKGSDFWPKKNFWKNRILFFETSEDKPPVKEIVYMLRNYGIQGAFAHASGVFFGRPKAYTEIEKKDLYEALRRVVGIEFERPDLPVVANMDFGHTDPKMVLPLGGKVRIDCAAKEVCFLESFTTTETFGGG
jgi:muramoyltetrapeptide carboxypeptidase LdcA involved in peptidoglycan recycling